MPTTRGGWIALWTGGPVLLAAVIALTVFLGGCTTEVIVIERAPRGPRLTPAVMRVGGSVYVDPDEVEAFPMPRALRRRAI